MAPLSKLHADTENMDSHFRLHYLVVRPPRERPLNRGPQKRGHKPLFVGPPLSGAVNVLSFEKAYDPLFVAMLAHNWVRR